MYDDTEGCRWQQERGNMNKKIIAGLVAVISALCFTGCGENQIPDLTDEQMQMVGEFTAITMLRYDAKHRSRLVDYTSLLESPEPETKPEPEPTREPAGMDPVDDTPVIGANSQTGTNAGLEGTLEFPEGVSVTFIGQALYDSYPETEDGFAITATRGKELLVLRFSISNATAQDQTFDLLTMEPEFRVTVNGDYSRTALFTGLENDFVTFRKTIPAGESTTAELVIEVDTEMADHITSISLKVKNGSKTCITQLL